MECRYDFNECAYPQYFCPNGKCTNHNPGYSCECNENFYGSRCDIPGDQVFDPKNSKIKCSDWPEICGHYGKCLDVMKENGVATIKCSCTAERTGIFCELWKRKHVQILEDIAKFLAVSD